MNKIKNVSNSAITINLPNVRYRTELRPKQERPLPDDVFMDGIGEPDSPHNAQDIRNHGCCSEAESTGK